VKRILFYAADGAAVLAAILILLYVFTHGGFTKNTGSSILNAITQATSTPPAPPPPVFTYVEVVDSCGPYFTGTCVNLRAGPGTEFPSVLKIRTGMVLRVADSVTTNGQVWYRIKFDDEIRYPERVSGDWYVSAENVRVFTDEGDKLSWDKIFPATSKHIYVNITEEMLYAYDGNTLFMEEPISTGLDLTPTPLGTFWVYKKTPSRYMQGPLPGVSDQVYDLPGVPWNLYFTYDGAVIHGAYWHDHFGHPWSHGCVNLSPEMAKKLYEWADIGTTVTVRN
jgi:hypothetical protein